MSTHDNKKYDARSTFGISIERLEELNDLMRDKMGIDGHQYAKKGDVTDLLKIKSIFEGDVNELSFMMFYTGYASGMANMLRIIGQVVASTVGTREAIALIDVGSSVLESQLISISGLDDRCECKLCRKARGEIDSGYQPYHR